MEWTPDAVDLALPTRFAAHASAWLVAGLGLAAGAWGLGAVVAATEVPRVAAFTVDEASDCLRAERMWPGRRCVDLQRAVAREIPDFDTFAARRTPAREAWMRGSGPPIYLSPPDRAVSVLTPFQRETAWADWLWIQRDPGLLAHDLGLLRGEARAEAAMWRRTHAAACWTLGGVGLLGLVGAAWAWSRPRTIRVRLGLDGVTVGSVHVPRAAVDAITVRRGRVIVFTGGREVRSVRLADPRVLKGPLAAWRRLSPVRADGRPDAALASLRAGVVP